MRCFITAFVVALFLSFASTLYAEEDEALSEETQQEEPQAPRPPKRKLKKRYFGTEKPERIDAGVFHVAFAAGGNFYIEPKYQVDATTGSKETTGEYFKDFGFQGGVYFDYDYSEMTENVPLALRGMVGYKYILSSVHVFTFDGMVRRIFRVSDNSTFGVGMGGSAAVWYRSITSTSPDEEVIFLPSFLVGAGFEFDPFMTDFKWLINRVGGDNTIMGFELYFGFRL